MAAAVRVLRRRDDIDPVARRARRRQPGRLDHPAGRIEDTITRNIANAIGGRTAPRLNCRLRRSDPPADFRVRGRRSGDRLAR